MQIENYQFPKSSFLSMDKDMELIINKILKNDRLKKLLYYNSKDALSKPNLTEDESLGLFGTQIINKPKIEIDDNSNLLNFLIVRFDDFSPNFSNTEFRDNIIEFDIITHFSTWNLENFAIRAYKIAAELDTMFEKKHLTGIGQLNFISGEYINVNQEYGGFCLKYLAIHGGEDKYNAIPPKEDKDIVQNFNKMYNEKWIEDQP